MSHRLRHARGALIRLTRNCRFAVAGGVLLLMPAVVLQAGDYGWESWWTDGAGLVSAATGIALMAAGLGDRRPDWFEPTRPGGEPED